MQFVWIATALSYRLACPILSVVYLRDIRQELLQEPSLLKAAKRVSRDEDSAQLKQIIANDSFIRHVHQVAGYLKSPSSILIFECDEICFLSLDWKLNTCNLFIPQLLAAS